MWLFKKKKAEPVMLEHYVLYHGAFREEFEREGKASFYFYLRPSDTHFNDVNESYIRQAAVLAEVLCQGFEMHVLEDELCWSMEIYGVQAWDYFALRRGNEEIGENCLKNGRGWLEEIAELSILSDYNHAVWTILLGEGYPYELLKERLQVFCDKMGLPLEIKE